MAYVPWRTLRGWACLACGECCKWYRVPLTSYEYARIVELLGAEFVEVSDAGDPCLRRVGGTCVFQDASGLCLLQPLGLKPIACKLWPFKVRRGCDDPRALFVYEGEEYCVYVNVRCRGVNAGTLADLVRAICEVIELHKNPNKPQVYSTSRLTAPLLAAHRTSPAPGLDYLHPASALVLVKAQEGLSRVLQEIRRVSKARGRLGVVSVTKECGEPLLRLYELIHMKWPEYVDCRPIYVERSLGEAGFAVREREVVKLLGLPAELVVASKPRRREAFPSSRPP